MSRTALLRLKADGFGALRGEFTFDPGKLTLVIDENERGKSTMLAALAAGLYGLDGDRRSHRVVTPLDRWRPWRGGTYRVELELEHEGQRYVIKRDFERGTVEVWNGTGREVTTDFREGRDEFPVGLKLLGLSADEFEKCAFVEQGELDGVVPAEERVRRGSTLAGRLENAADTKVGDTNAHEALGVLEGALRRYNCPDVEFTGTVDHAIQRLELKRGTLDTEIKTLEHDLAAIAKPLEQLAKLSDEEQAARSLLDALEADRRAAIVADVRRRLDENDKQQEEVDKLRAEAEKLAPAGHLAPDSEARLQEAVARYEEARKNIESLEARRREDVDRDRKKLDKDAGDLRSLETLTAEDADRCVALAAELRRLAAEDSKLRDEVFSLRENLATRGHDPERFHFLNDRFGRLGEKEQRLLRKQSEVALVFQTEVANLETQRTDSSETLREIDAMRTQWRVPGGSLLALGVAGLIGGIAVAALRGQPTWTLTLFAIAGGLLLAGIVMLVSGTRAREADRVEALRRLTEAQGRLNQMRMQRAETESGLADIAKRMRYRGQVDLLRDWNEYARMLDESSPAVRAQDRLLVLEAERREAAEKAKTVLDRAGGGAPDPANLEQVATGVRKLLGIRQRMGEIERSSSWIDDERRVVEAQAAGFKERAVRIIQTAGMTYDPDRSWGDHAKELVERMRGRTRLATLKDELLPRAQKRLLPDEEVDDLRRQLEGLEAASDGTPAPKGPRRTAAEVESESRKARETLDKAQKRRADLRVEVEEVWRRYHAEHPERLAQRERIELALARARRFKHAVELARQSIEGVATETHRKWADYLNERVSELLGRVGTKIGHVRFGDDLDFSVKVGDDQQLARGRADAQLSAGARDQLYLAVRLAISEFLSRGRSRLPLLLDDVFVTSDDERTRAAMRVLVEHYAQEHQIILLTCHRARFEAIARLEPALWQAVQVVDGRTASPIA